MNLNNVAVFIEVVRAGSFTAAGRTLGLPKTTVSRRVAALERSLGVRLLHRTTRSLSLTDPGRRYYKQSRDGMSVIETANRQAAGEQVRPSGTIRVTSPAEDHYMASITPKVLDLYPDVSIEFVLTDDHVDLIAERIDVALRGGQLPDSSLVARKLASGRRIVCAAPAYLEQAGRPHSPDEVEHHSCVVHGHDLDKAFWNIKGPDGAKRIAVKARLAANSVRFVLHAARVGLGLALLPEVIAAQDLNQGLLERVLPDWETPTGGLYAVYPSGRHQPAAVRAFVDFLVEQGFGEFPTGPADR